jgi:hypothetical protein
MDKMAFLDTLAAARAEWEALLAQVGEARMAQPGAVGKWPVKDTIAHVAWSELELAPVMRTHILTGSELWDLSVDERDEIVYQQNRDRPLHDIMMEEQQAYAQLREAAELLSDEDLNDPHRFQDLPVDWIPWRIFAGSSFKHSRDHASSIRAWLATL